MGLPKIIQIPCHHVLTNQNAFKLKKGAPLNQFFNINLRIGIIKKLLFWSYFRHISLCFYSNFNWERLLDAELNFASNEYPLDILLAGPSTQKIRNTWNNVMMMWSSRCFRYFLFLGLRANKKYDEWVLVGCRI